MKYHLSSWAVKSWQKAKKLKIVDENSDPKGIMTKEEVMVILDRLKKLDK